MSFLQNCSNVRALRSRRESELHVYDFKEGFGAGRLSSYLRMTILSLFLCTCTAIVVFAADNDNDGMTDAYESFFGLNISSNDAAIDYDEDSLQNIDESYLNSDPFAADTDRDGFLDIFDSNVIFRAYIPLGSPYWTDADDCLYGWPDWMLSAYKMDGAWNTNPPSWHLLSSESNSIGILSFDINRSIITNDIVMDLNLHDTANSSLYLDLAGTNGTVVITNLLGNLLNGTAEDTTLTFNISLTNNPAASTICLRRETGEITIHSALLYMDADLDRLDDQQEDQLGTDPDSEDTDSDGLSDYTEVFVTHTDPLLADTDGDGLSDGDEVNTHGTNPLLSDTDNDGLNDDAEINTWGTNPNNPDTDGDGLTDGAEVAFGRDPNSFDAYSYLVFQEQFETNTVALGELNGQHNWTASVTNAAIIQTNLVYDGSQSLLIDNPDSSTTSIVSQVIVATNDLQVWFDLVLSPEPAPEPTAAPAGISTMYFSGGQLVIYDGTSETWITLTNHPPVTTYWARLSIMADFETQKWLVALDGTLVATEIGFASHTTYASALSIVGNRGRADNITIGREMPGDLDVDNDGLTAAQELAAGSDPFIGDSDGDGMGDAAEVRWGFPADQTNTYFRLDVDSGHDTWFTGFETNEGYHFGNLLGQNGWNASSNVAVTASHSFSGIQSITIPDSGSTNLLSMKSHFGTHGRDRVWISLYLKPVMGVSPSPPASSICALSVCNDRVYAYDGALEAWVTSAKVSPIGSNEWVRIDILADFNTKMYLVCLNGVLAIENVQFGDISIEELSSLSVSGSDEAGETWVDDIMLAVQEPAGALDFDADGLSNADEYTAGTDTRLPDTDGDGVTDLAEINIFNTDPLNSDSDSDGMPDGWEIANGLDPLNDEASRDPDTDGLTNLEEFQQGTSLSNPDTDNDSLTDGDEVNIHNTNPLQADTDGDALPDAWEVQNATNPLVADADADPDGDRLTNLEEYVAGTDPFDPDSDDDGIDDYQEQNLRTNPLNPDFNGEVVNVQVIPGIDTVSRTGAWYPHGDSICAWQRRGELTYAVTVTTSDIYRLEVDVEQLYELHGSQPLELALYLDGVWIGRERVVAPYGQSTYINFFTPWILAGDHELTIFWDNAMSRPWLRLNEINVQALGGYDANTNGVKDWVECYLTNNYSIETSPDVPAMTIVESEVSPICLEGRSRFPELVLLSDGTPVAPAAGARWYADVPLAENAVQLVASFENQPFLQTNTIVWISFDLLENRDLSIRTGDALRLAVLPDGITNGVVEIAVGGVTNYTTTVDAPISHIFPQAGSYSIIGSHTDTNGVEYIGSSIINVVDGGFSTNNMVVWANKLRTLSCPDIPAECVVEFDERMKLSVTNAVSGGVNIDVISDINDPRRAVLRLGENGAIMDDMLVDGLRYHSTASESVLVLETYADGSKLIEEVLTLSRPKPGITIELRIFVGGVIFDDGTKVRTLTVDDFDEIDGFRNLYILPAGVRTSVCHTTKIYHNGVYLGIYSAGDVGSF